VTNTARLFLLSCLACAAVVAAAAELTPYEQRVVAAFSANRQDLPIRVAYEARAAGVATPVQRKVIRSAEMIYEDRQLAACVLPALADAGTFDDIFRRVVARGQGPAIVADAKRLYPASEWTPAIPANAAPEEQAISAAVLIARGARVDGEGEAALKALERRMVLNYYLTFATGGKCTPSPQLRQLIGKAR
jgi:hypothetical protein